MISADEMAAALEHLRVFARTAEEPCLEPSEVQAIIEESEIAGDWAASDTYGIGVTVFPLARNGHFYRVVSAGVSGATSPDWTTGLGDWVTDGSVIWEEAGSSDSTVDLDGAVQLAWLVKASRAANLHATSSAGQSSQPNMVYDQCMREAAKYQLRRCY